MLDESKKRIPQSIHHGKLYILWRNSEETQNIYLKVWLIGEYQKNLCVQSVWHNSYVAVMCISSVQSLSRVQLFVISWTAACQTSLSSTNSWSLPKLMFIESQMPCNHHMLCHPLLLPSIFPSIRDFTNESVLPLGGQSIRVSASASVLPMNPQDWSPLGWTGWFSLESKGLSRVFSNTTVQKHQFFGAQLSSQSNSHIHTWLLEKP